jgi:hypothetical protein
VTKEVIGMEISSKSPTGGKVKSGMAKSLLQTFYRNVPIVSAQNALPREMLAHGVPYEATRTYAVMKSEFERKRSLAMVEAHRRCLLGF